MADAVPIVLNTDLSTSRSLIPVIANNESGAYAGGATLVLRATITERLGRIHVTGTVTDNKTQQDRHVIELSSASSSGLLQLLNDLARDLDSAATSFSTKNNRALQAYVTAASTANQQQRISALTDAISIDPSFGLGYIGLADTRLQFTPTALPSLLQRASLHKSSFTPLDRARFNAFLARFSHAPINQQESAFQTILQIAPNDVDALVTTGSLSFLHGDATDGTKYLQRALALNPGNVNVRRDLATGLFESKQFAPAEKILVGLDNNPAILPELAICVLMEGDVARANTIADRLFASIQNQDAKTLFRAVWLKLSGQTQQATQLLTTTNFTQPAARAIAYSELAVWQMLAHNFATAKQLAQQAQQLDPRPETFGSIAAILAAANGSAGSWKQQVDSSFLASNQPTKQLVLGYGLFLGGHYADSAQIWQAILQQSGGTDLRARAMLAASFNQQGKSDQARQINVEPFVPDFGDLYAAVSFFEMNRDLRIGVR